MQRFRGVKGFLFLILFLPMVVYGSVYSYTIDKSSTTVGDGTWGSILKLEASLNDTYLTLKVSKQDGTAFKNTNTLYIKVGTFEEYGVNREVLTIYDGETSKVHSHNLNDITDDYPKEFYARVENSGGMAWVGPIKVTRYETTVSSVTPTSAKFNEQTTFTVTGSNLPSTLTMFVPDCENMTALGGSSTSKRFSCTPMYTTGSKAALVKDKSGGTILKSLNISVSDANVATPTISSIVPTTAKINEKTTFIVDGSNLPSTLAMFVPYCEGMQTVSNSPVQVKFSCTPSYGYLGIQSSEVKDKAGGTILKTFDVNVIDSAVTVTSIMPSTVKLDERTVFTVHGTNLPSDLALFIPECTGITQFGGNASALEFACTPSYTTGVKKAEIKDEAGGTLLKILDVTVEDIASNATVSSVTPATTNINVKTTFTVTGTALPSSLAMFVPYCVDMTAIGGSDVSRQFTCTPTREGIQASIVKDKSGGTVLRSFPVDVIDPRTAHYLSVDVIDVGGGSGQVTSTPAGITNCRYKRQGTCQAAFKDDEVLLTAHPEGDSFVDFSEARCTKIDGNTCTISMDYDEIAKVNFKPLDDTMMLTVDSTPQSLKIKPNEPMYIDFKVTENRDDNVYVLQIDLNDGSSSDVINCRNNFSMKDVVTCEVEYTSAGKYTLTATAYADSEMKIKSNMISLPIEVSTATDDTKYTGHQNQDHLKKFWTNNPTTAKEAFIVDTATGTQNLNLSFLAQKGQLDLALGITYNSGLAKDADKGVLGQGWSHSYGALARIQKVNNNTLILHTSGSRKTTFVESNGEYISANRPTGILANYYDKIIKDGSGYTLVSANKSKKHFGSDGKLISTSTKQGIKLFYKYNADNRLEQIEEPISGILLNYEYYDDGSLKIVSDKIGRKVYFHYSAGHLTSITDEGNVRHIFGNNHNGELESYKIEKVNDGFYYFKNSYDDLGRVYRQVDAEGYVTKFDYDESDYSIIETTVTIQNNHTRVYRYNNNYQLLEFTDELGNKTTNKYTLSGLLRSTTNPKGLITRYEYEDSGLNSKVESPNNTTVRHYYDENANRTLTTDELGYSIVYTYDDDNRLKKVERNVDGDVKALVTHEYITKEQTYSDGSKANIVHTMTTTTAKGNKSTKVFHNGLLFTAVTAEGVNTSYAYDDIGQLKVQTLHADGGEYETTFEYNDLGQVIKATDPEGKVVSKTYSIFGSVKTLTDAMGNTLTNEYDNNGNLIKTIAPNNTITRYDYNQNNQLDMVTDANGHTSTIKYDKKGRKEFIQDSEGRTLAKYEYDELDTLVRTALYDEDGAATTATSLEYDIHNRHIKKTSKLGRLTRTTEQHLDSKGRVINSLNPARQGTTYKYENHFDTITEVTAHRETTYQTVDDEANLKTLTDLSNNTSKFDHDSQKDKTLEESALGETHKTTYNSQYLVETFTNARGQTRNFTYYKNGWLKTATSDGAVWAFEYDNNGNLLTMSSDKGETISRSYDLFNRVTSYTDQNGNTLGYAYDKVGNLLELTYPGGKKVTYTYDSSNRLKTVTDWNGVTLVTYSYTRQGKLLEEKRANGTKRRYIYYKDIGELEAIRDTKADGTTIVSYDYEYDIKGNIIKETKRDDSKSTIFDYTYTPKGTLEKVLINPREEIYNASNLMMTHIGDNRAETIDAQPIKYDKDGNMIEYMLKGKLTTLEYDEKSRLTKVGDIEHIYSIEDAKIETIAKGKSTKFVVDTNRKLSQLLVEESSTGKKTYHIYGAGLVASIDDEGTGYYHYDYRGSTTALTNSNGDITDRYTYLPYGKMINHKGFSKTRFLYVGKYGIEKEASGLYYMRARYYDADIKRFISKDSLIGSVSDGLSLNRYLYANGNPIIGIDRTGNKVEIIIKLPIDDKSNYMKLPWDKDYGHALINVNGTVYDFYSKSPIKYSQGILDRHDNGIDHISWFYNKNRGAIFTIYELEVTSEEEKKISEHLDYWSDKSHKPPRYNFKIFNCVDYQRKEILNNFLNFDIKLYVDMPYDMSEVLFSHDKVKNIYGAYEKDYQLHYFNVKENNDHKSFIEYLRTKRNLAYNYLHNGKYFYQAGFYKKKKNIISPSIPNLWKNYVWRLR